VIIVGRVLDAAANPGSPEQARVSQLEVAMSERIPGGQQTEEGPNIVCNSVSTARSEIYPQFHAS